MAFSVLEIPGQVDNHNLGRVIGECFRSQINTAVKRRKEDLGPTNYNKLTEASKNYAAITQTHLPSIMDEIEGTAFGAKIDFLDAFLLCCHELYDPSEQEHCTTIAGHEPGDKRILGHNEDWPLPEGSPNPLYLLKATIQESASLVYSIISLCYPDELMGTAVTMNDSGLILAVNSIETNNIHPGVPRIVLSRAITRCQTIKQSVDLINETPRASGYNFILAQNDKLVNVEVAGEDIEVETAPLGLWVHTNHFATPKMQKHGKEPSTQSLARYERASKLARFPMTVTDMKAALSDNEGPSPILNDGTLASVVTIPAEKILYVRQNKPVLGEFEEHHFRST
ncbi:hypothetical protein HY440_02245 [Candidatus Microgenomates bacterium]|nr:hypothetical protein [Candidatus Microgenomates bacterium]